MKPSVAVLGNCTHKSMALTLSKTSLFSRVESFELYSMEPAKYADLSQYLGEFGFILTIEHGAKFKEVSTRSLRERYGNKVFSFPTPFFSGYQPDMAYLTYGGALFTSENVLGDYHSGLILQECKEGLTESDVVDRYVSGEAFERLNLTGIWQDSITELKEREKHCEIKLSAFFDNIEGEGQQFLTFNHPRELFFAFVARSFIQRSMGFDYPVVQIPTQQHGLYQDVFWPVHPFVAKHFGIEAGSEQQFKSPQRLGEKRFSFEEFARASYHSFCDDRDLSRFLINTPSYLSSNISSTLSPTNKAARVNVAVKKPQQPRLIMTHFGRSGSTVIARMLEKHPDILWLHEIFSLVTIASRSTYDYTKDEMLAMVDDKIEEHKEKNAKKLVGYEIKLMNYLQNPSCNLIDYIKAVDNQSGYLHVVLQRRNTLKRILSVYKAMQTKVYHVDNNASVEQKTYSLNFRNLFDPDTGMKGTDLPGLIKAAQDREASVLANYRKLGIDFLHLYYEDDVENDPTRAYSRIVEYAGLDSFPGEVSLKKTSSKMSEELVNYERVQIALVGTQYEWMIEE